MKPPHTEAEIARLIDHTLLKADATETEVRALCTEALQYGFASVCVNPWYVALCAELVAGSAVRVCTVIGFPLGATLPQVKTFEAQKAIEEGAHEVDMVINLGALKSGKFEAVEADIRRVVEAAHRGDAICKVIIETALLSHDEKIRASQIAIEAGADFVKTSTGFSTGGASEEDVRLIRSTIGANAGLKASGGIRTLEDLLKMVASGATRIGASAGVKIIQELRAGETVSRPGPRRSADPY
jgi:deoxyribose-phosphate aldolase